MLATQQTAAKWDLSDCLGNEELANLFENAFDAWRTGADSEARRAAPRLTTIDAKPIFVVGYIQHSNARELNVRAEILDISADGLGLAMKTPVPCASVLRFAFDDANGLRQFGEARVINVAARRKGFRVGLCFDVQAGELELDEVAPQASDSPKPFSRWLEGFDQLRQRWLLVYHHVQDRHRGRRVLRRTLAGRDVVFEVRALLFRYVATLCVDGQQIASQSGALRCRLRNLFEFTQQPTAIELRANGFLAWATLYANTVSYVYLDMAERRTSGLFDVVLGPPRGKNADRTTNGRPRAQDREVGAGVASTSVC